MSERENAGTHTTHVHYYSVESVNVLEIPCPGMSTGHPAGHPAESRISKGSPQVTDALPMQIKRVTRLENCPTNRFLSLFFSLSLSSSLLQLIIKLNNTKLLGSIITERE